MDTPGSSRLTELPLEIWLHHILPYIYYPAVCTLSLVCRRWHEVIRHYVENSQDAFRVIDLSETSMEEFPPKDLVPLIRSHPGCISSVLLKRHPQINPYLAQYIVCHLFGINPNNDEFTVDASSIHITEVGIGNSFRILGYQASISVSTRAQLFSDSGSLTNLRALHVLNMRDVGFFLDLLVSPSFDPAYRFRHLQELDFTWPVSEASAGLVVTDWMNRRLLNSAIHQIHVAIFPVLKVLRFGYIDVDNLLEVCSHNPRVPHPYLEHRFLKALFSWMPLIEVVSVTGMSIIRPYDYPQLGLQPYEAPKDSDLVPGELVPAFDDPIVVNSEIFREFDFSGSSAMLGLGIQWGSSSESIVVVDENDCRQSRPVRLEKKIVRRVWNDSTKSWTYNIFT
ncbi:uncharacterized protein V1516DRAFT_682187 [Lipomyces oligophaga]|uniref:uncharacterized protein n=1 Tax=Lipomyces oligophaga TaxID=45792 RepID=UPI0034CD95C3